MIDRVCQAWMLGFVLFGMCQKPAGCRGDDAATAKVSGVITLDGRPLENANVTFEPIDEGKPATGLTDKNGRYTLENSLRGQHTVRVSTASESTDQASGKATRRKEQLPTKYNSKSALKVEVRAGDNRIDFDLSSEGEIIQPGGENQDEAVALQDLQWAAAGGENDPQVVFLSNYVKVQSALARRSCKMSAEQEAQIKKIDAKWLSAEITQSTNTPVKGVVAGIARFLGGGVAAAPRVQAQQPHEVCKIVKARIDEKLIEVLTTEQRVEFELEKNSRAEFRSAAMAGALVAALDRQLYLDREQRVGLTESVTEWLKNKDLYWTFYFQNQGYMPDIPANILNKHLDNEQRTALQGMQKWNYEMDQLELQMMGQQANLVIDE